MCYNNYWFVIFREIAEALDIDAEGSRPEQSNPVNMPSALRHGSVPVRTVFYFLALKFICLINSRTKLFHSFWQYFNNFRY